MIKFIFFGTLTFLGWPCQASPLCRNELFPFVSDAIAECRKSPTVRYNHVGIRDFDATPPEAKEIRIVLFGTGKSAAEYLPLPLTLAKRLEFHLREFSGRNYRVVNGILPGETPLDSLRSASKVLRAYQPQFVYYYIHGSNDFTNMAALQPWLTWDNLGQVTSAGFVSRENPLLRCFFWILGLPDEESQRVYLQTTYQLGLISQTRMHIFAKAKPEKILTPLTSVLHAFSSLADLHHATFSVLWPGLSIQTPQPPGDSASWMAKFLSPLSENLVFYRNDILGEFLKQNIPVVTSLQAGSFLKAQREVVQPADDRKEILRESIDTLAKYYATSILANN